MVRCLLDFCILLCYCKTSLGLSIAGCMFVEFVGALCGVLTLSNGCKSIAHLPVFFVLKNWCYIDGIKTYIHQCTFIDFV